MKNIRKYCEQLCLAGKLLKNNSMTEDRLALVLLDNLVDVLLFQAVKACFQNLNSSWMYSESRPGKCAQRKILRVFPQRCDFLMNPPKGVFGPTLSEDEGQLLKAMHRLRNETYHEGVIRNKIIHAVVHAYAAQIPAVLGKLWSGWVHSRADLNEVEDFLSQHNLQETSISKSVFEDLCRISLGEVDHTTESLRSALEDDILCRIARAKEMFDYATAESNFKGDEVFKWDEFWDWANTREKFDMMDKDVNEKQRAFLQKHYKNYKPRLNLALFPKMLKIAKGIPVAGTDAAIMVLYWKIDDDLKPMEEFIYELVIAFEEHVEGQIKRMREKRRRSPGV